MNLLIYFGFFVIMQAVQPPVPGNPKVPVPGSTTTVLSQSQFADYSVAGTDAIMRKSAEGTFEIIHQLGHMPDWLQQRNRGNTIDQEQSGQMNDILTKLMLALIPLSVCLAIGANFLGVATGKSPSPGLVVGSIAGVAFGSFIGFNNRMLYGELVDLAATAFAAIAGADLFATVDHGLTIATLTAPIMGAIMAIFYGIIVFCLTVVWWIQWAWVIVLSSMLGIATLMAFTPYAAPFGRQIIKRWAGSVIDPLLMFTAIKLAQPFVGTLNGAPTVVQQAVTVAFLIVAWQSPGFFVGAVGGSVPWIAEAYMMGRLIGVGRMFNSGRAAAGSGRGGGGTAANEDMPLPGRNDAARWKPVKWALGPKGTSGVPA